MALQSGIQKNLATGVKWRSGAGLPGGVGGGGIGIPGLGFDPCEFLDGTAKEVCQDASRAFSPDSPRRPSNKRAKKARFTPPTTFFNPSFTPEVPCPGVRCVRIGTQCVDFITGAPCASSSSPTTAMTGPQTAVQGGFGLPAYVPTEVVRRQLSCRRGFVLGIDDLCYPKALLSRRSKYRKHRMPPRPTLSRRDEVAIRRAGRAKDRVLALAKDAGLFASKTKPSPKKAAAPAVHHGGHLHVLSEHVNS